MSKNAFPVAFSVALASFVVAAACSPGSFGAGGSSGDGSGSSGTSASASGSSSGSGGTGGGGDDGGGTGGGMPVLPFQADTPAVYVAKVKNILLGLPPTDMEVQQVAADPTQPARSLIDGRMAAEAPSTPRRCCASSSSLSSRRRSPSSIFSDHGVPRARARHQLATRRRCSSRTLRSSSRARWCSSSSCSRASPLTAGVTTHQSFDDDARSHGALRGSYVTPGRSTTRATSKTCGSLQDENGEPQRDDHGGWPHAGPIPLAQTLDPTSTNFMHWYDPDVANAATAT